ncbi:MAG: hypothetical protein Q4A58_07925 [Fusobacterium sp.]|nr:hypothetical protein [Fusobacterium sp.]
MQNENEKNESIMVLTEKTLIIFTNSFGEIPLNIINDITLNGFSSHSLEFKNQ